MFNVIFLLLIWPVAIIGLIIFFRQRKKIDPSVDKEWYLRIALSKEDAISQLFFLMAILFLGVALLAFARDFGNAITWQAILLFTSFAGLIIAYYYKVIYSLAISLIGIIIGWEAHAVEWIGSLDVRLTSIFAGIVILALIYFVIGHLHEREPRYKRFAMVFLLIGIGFTTFSMLFLSTKVGLFMIEEASKGSSFFKSSPLTISLIFFLLTLICVTIFSISQKVIAPVEVATICLLVILFSAIAFLPQQKMFLQYSDPFSGGQDLSAIGVVWASLFNFLAFLQLLGLIFSGYVRGEEWLINFGSFFLFLFIIFKYFDWFFTFLDKSFFFISTGIFMFIVGWLMERGRRYMISNIKFQTQQASK